MNRFLLSVLFVVNLLTAIADYRLERYLWSAVEAFCCGCAFASLLVSLPRIRHDKKS